MKILNFILTYFFVFSLITSSFGQSKKQQKWDEAILSLKQTEFIKKYESFKVGIEKTLKEFHLQKVDFNQDEVKIVEKAYEDSVEDFNRILDKIKRDFTDKETRKYLSNNPEQYCSNFDGLLYNAGRSFDNNCTERMEKMMDSDLAAFGLMETAMLIGLVKELVGMVGKMNTKMKKVSGEYIEDNMLSELRLKKWDEY